MTIRRFHTACVILISIKFQRSYEAFVNSGEWAKAEGLYGAKETARGAGRRGGFLRERNASKPGHGGARPGWGREVRGEGRGGGKERRAAATRLPSHPEPPTCGWPSTPAPPLRRGSALPPGPPPAYPLPQRQRGCGGGEGQRARRGRRGGDAAVAPRGTGSKSAPARGGSKSGRRRRRSGWRDGGPSESPHTPAAAGTSYWMYCFLHSGVMCAERCSANFILASPPHPQLGSSSSRRRQRRRRRQQRFRLLPTWAPARRGAELLSSSAAAEVSSEPPSRHLPPPLHSPAPPRPLYVIAMVTAYAAPTEGAE